ncbi:MAG: DUF4367 domain-containing protein, partial [Chloroflexaceae bacterium]|nr:DUF4367 domain-containing protein [Chloroflexaceae bacterium]
MAPIPAQTPDAWAKARALLPPTIAVYKPGWMPERFGQAELVEAVTGKADAVRYTIAYHSGSEETVFFILNIGADALGNSPPTQGTSEKVRVLGNEALFLAAPEDGRLELNWHADKQRYQMKVYGKGHQVTRDELLRIANSL